MKNVSLLFYLPLFWMLHYVFCGKCQRSSTQSLKSVMTEQTYEYFKKLRVLLKIIVNRADWLFLIFFFTDLRCNIGTSIHYYFGVRLNSRHVNLSPSFRNRDSPEGLVALCSLGLVAMTSPPPPTSLNKLRIRSPNAILDQAVVTFRGPLYIIYRLGTRLFIPSDLRF